MKQIFLQTTQRALTAAGNNIHLEINEIFKKQ